MSEVVCNYAIARFRPYRETSEFVNVGVVLICQQVNYFGYLFETRRHKRITDFFPELDLEVFKAGLSGLLKELTRITGREHDEELKQLVLREEEQASLARFRELVRPREALFHFGETGTVLAMDPRAKLKEMFQYYIERQFARDREYQEIIMRRHLAEFLRKHELERHYRLDQKVGDDTYHVILPFVHLQGSQGDQATTPRQGWLDRNLPLRRCVGLDCAAPETYKPTPERTFVHCETAKDPGKTRGGSAGDLSRTGIS
jgi:hypothetical protein